LENGWKPVLQTAFPLTFTFPFGEMIVFTMLLPYVKQPKASVKIGLLGILIAGIVLSLVMVLNISVLGVYRASIEQFPLLTTMGAIEVAEVIQRFDAIALSALIIGGFIKILLFFYAGIHGIRDLFAMKQRKQTRYMLSIFAPLIALYSVAMAPSVPEHIDVGLKQVPYYLHIPMQTGIPVLLAMIAFAKQRLQRQK
jgi:spore germination protein KB